MKVSFENGVLTVRTGVKEADLKKINKSNFILKDEKGNDLYMLSVDSDASIAKFGMNCNQIIDGELAVVMVFPAGCTKNDIIAMYGDALVAAEQAMEKINLEITVKAEAYSKIFE